MPQIHISGVWQNAKGPSDLSSFRGLGTSRITWGEPAESETSSYEFDGGVNNVDVDGTAWALGTFIHHNYPIITPFERFTVDLQITASVANGPSRDLVITFEHYESPNRGPEAAQADVVSVHALSAEDKWRAVRFVKIDGVESDMIFEGFYSHDLQVLNQKYTSPEGKSNTADLHVRLVRYNGPK